MKREELENEMDLFEGEIDLEDLINQIRVKWKTRILL